MRKPKVYYMRLKKMLVQLKQMKIELQQMHDEMEERYNNMSENRKDSDFGYDMGDIIDHLYYAFGSDMDSLIDYIDEAANGIKGLPLADGYHSQNGLEEYEEMNALDGYEDGIITKYNSECAPTAGTNDDSGNSGDYDEAIAALNSLAGMTGAYMGWRLGSSTGFNNRDEQKETPKSYQGYSTDDPEWRDEDNDGLTTAMRLMMVWMTGMIVSGKMMKITITKMNLMMKTLMKMTTMMTLMGLMTMAAMSKAEALTTTSMAMMMKGVGNGGERLRK